MNKHNRYFPQYKHIADQYPCAPAVVTEFGSLIKFSKYPNFTLLQQLFIRDLLLKFDTFVLQLNKYFRGWLNGTILKIPNRYVSPSILHAYRGAIKQNNDAYCYWIRGYKKI